MPRPKTKGSSRRVRAPDPARLRQTADPYPVGGSKDYLNFRDRDDVRRKASKAWEQSRQYMGSKQRKIFNELRQDTNDHPDLGDFPGDFNDPDDDGHPLNDDAPLEHVADAVFDAIHEPGYVRAQPGWRARTSNFYENWEDQMDSITDEYIKWKSSTPTPIQPECPPPEHDTPPVQFCISIVDMYSVERVLSVSVPDSQAAVPHLVSRGYLATTPRNPSLAVSLRTLEFYKHLRQRKPSFGVEAFVKVLCDLYKFPFRSQWKRAFRDAFEIFLSVVRKVEERLNSALKRDSPDWRVLNACPPCMYELDGEVALRYRVLMAMDGNDSQKRLDDGNAGDMREFQSNYWISLEEANQWEKGVVIRDDDDEEWEDVGGHELEDDGSGNDEQKVTDCVKNWKAAQSDSKKRVLGIFDESGWFVSSCRHGIVLWATDMVKSGEQYKYPLSIVNKALNVLGDRLAIGYDIGCKFGVTLANSTLGPRFQESGSLCCVNAYHGYAHNFKCQTQNHPNNLPGVGIEDFETMERFFSGSNTVAGLVRHATKFRRRLYLDLYMKQADADKYLQLGQMLYDNYRQALRIIEDDGLRLEETLTSEGITVDDLDRWQLDQREYFGSNLGKEPEDNIHRVAYVELLLEYNSARDFAEKKSSAFLHAVPQDYDVSQPGSKTYESTRSETQRLETARRRARERVKELDHELSEMELSLGIDSRWDPTMPQYHETLTYIKERRYHQALDALQKVVVQRLFELHRLNLSGIGYKARTLLAKAMRTRSRAIQSAVAKYNRAALELGRSNTLDFAQAAKYSFVEEFELLKNTHADLSEARWKEPVIREAMKRHQRIQRAKEEVIRLNIEIQRLYTAIMDEEEELSRVVRRLQAEDNPLTVILQDFAHYRTRVHRVILSKLTKTTELPHYTGTSLTRGRRKGAVEDQGMVIDNSAEPIDQPDDADEVESIIDDEEEEGRVGGIVDFIADLATS